MDRNNEPAGSSNQPEDNDDFMAQHATTVTAAKAKGAEEENQRQQKVKSLFYGADGAFAYGDDTDPTDPMLALMNECLADVKCDEGRALRQINAA